MSKKKYCDLCGDFGHTEKDHVKFPKLKIYRVTCESLRYPNYHLDVVAFTKEDALLSLLKSKQLKLKEMKIK